MASEDLSSRFADISSSEELIAAQKKERKELLAQTQKMKHSVPKGDKKKKKDVTAEITQLLADLDLKHEAELKEFELLNLQSNPEQSNELSELSGEVLKEGNDVDLPEDVASNLEHDTKSSEQNTGAEVKSTQRVSKAQKRRNKKAALERERNNAIAAQDLENLSGLRHLESEQIQKKLAEKKLAIFEIPADGDCLYKAIEHQLSILKVPPMSVQALREETSKYLLSHVDDYMPFLTNPDTGDPFTYEMYEKYCLNVAKTKAWGGHIEIQVLSHIIALPIEVIQAEGPNILTGKGADVGGPKLTLCYHRHVYSLGEHYNSVIPITE